MKTKKPIRPIWTTTVDPSEYDYVAQFTQTVKWANKNKELYPPTDVGKVWGLVQAYQRLERENAALREAGHLAEEIIVQRTDEIRHLERENAALRHSEESLASTVRGLEFELEKANKQIDGLFAELSSTGADELREYRAENHQISQKASKLCYDLIARERELEKANAALDWLNTHCMSAEPIMGRSTYRWTIEHDEPDIRAAISKAVA